MAEENQHHTHTETHPEHHQHQEHTHPHEHAQPAEAQHHAHAHHPKSGLNIANYYPHIAASVAYFIIALIMFWPITANITTAAPGSGGDTYQNLWNIWWVGYSTFNLHTSIWYTNLLFAPVGASLIYQTFSPVLSLLSVPFQAGGIPFAYNIIFFIGFFASGLGMFILADYLVKDKYAAFFAGLAFTFSSFHISQSYSHMHFIMIAWVPVALYFFLKMLNNERTYLSAFGLAVSFLLSAFMGTVEQSIMLLVLLLSVLVVFYISKERRHLVLSKNLWIGIAVSAVIVLVLGSPGLIPMLQAAANPANANVTNSLNTAQYNALWSDNVLSFILPTLYNGVFSGVSPSYAQIYNLDSAETSSYIGFVVIILAVFAAYKGWADVRVWVPILLLFGWLCLGPVVQLGGSITGIPALYALYHVIPGLNVLREPGRFDLVFAMFTSLLAAFGIKFAFERIKSQPQMVAKVAALSFISLLFLIESNGLPVSNAQLLAAISPAQIPPFYKALSNTTIPGNFTVLELPAVPNIYSPQPYLFPAIATYYTTASHRPIIGGYVTRMNSTQELSIYNIPLTVQSASLEYNNISYSSPINENYTNQTILLLYGYQTEFITVDKFAFSSNALNALGSYLYKTFGQPIYNDNATAAFSTANAIENSVFKSFVAYPLITEWSSTTLPINGTQTQLWVSAPPGAIKVYAPYRNTTDAISRASSGQSGTINATISFDAISFDSLNRFQSGNQTLVIEQPVSSTQAYRLATIYVAPALRRYSVNVTMESGPVGNIYYFLSNNTQTGAVGITNITIKRAK